MVVRVGRSVVVSRSRVKSVPIVVLVILAVLASSVLGMDRAAAAPPATGGKLGTLASAEAQTVEPLTQAAPPYTPMAPVRVADTRVGQPVAFPAVKVPVADGGTLEVPVGGVNGVPGDAAAAVVNITATAPDGAGHLRVFPCGQARPGASTLNYPAGASVANGTIVGLGTGGKICVFTPTRTHVLVDVVGYFPAGAAYTALAPVRIADTRVGQPVAFPAVKVPVAAGGTLEVPVGGANGVPADAAAVVANITATAPDGAGHLRVYPCGQARPGASTLNYPAGASVANGTIVGLGTGGKMCVYTPTRTHVLVDIVGYMPAPLPPPTQKWVDPGTATTVSAGSGYAVAIPAAALSQRSLVTVTPLPPADGVLPQADVTVSGPVSGRIEVTLPLPPSDGSGPVLLREDATGVYISSGSAVHVTTADGRTAITASVAPSGAGAAPQALSAGPTAVTPPASPTAVTQSATQTRVSAGYSGFQCRNLSEQQRAQLFACADIADMSFPSWYQNRAKVDGLVLNEKGAKTTPCGYWGGTASAAGTVPFGVACIVETNGQAGRYAFTNNFYGQIGPWGSAAIYKYAAIGGSAASDVQLPEDISLLMRPIADAAKGSYLVPGATVALTKERGSPDTTLAINSDLIGTGVYHGMQYLAGQVSDALLAAGAADPAILLKFSQCATSQLTETAGDCFLQAMQHFADTAADAGTGSKWKNVAQGASVLKGVLKWADIGTFALSLAFAAVAFTPNASVKLRNVTPILPPTNRGGNDYIARDPGTGLAVQVLNGTPYSIPDSGTFNCLATTRVVWDIGALQALLTVPAGSATCSNLGREPWTYTPSPDGGNTGTNVILRSANGSNWLINGAGEIQTIPDLGTYGCLAAANPVIWNTPGTKINDWRPIGATPATCGGGTGASARIAAGDHHTCAIVAGGQVNCWGVNWGSEHPDGALNHRTIPVPVNGITGATAIAAGWNHTCAIVAGGEVRCWGENSTGQLGDGSTTPKSVPARVSGISGATALSAGWDHTCVILSGGEVKCWGSNYFGQLGDGTTTDSAAPVKAIVTGITGATALALKAYDTCAIVTGGQVKCWGSYGSHLGDGKTPVTIADISGATALAAGTDDACAIVTGGQVKCWGQNYGGPLGDLTKPVTIAGMPPAYALDDGIPVQPEHHTCVIVTGGAIMCWGTNSSGEVGDGSNIERTSPTIASGITGATDITIGLNHVCAVISGGQVQCWGGNRYGQLGDGTTTDRNKPVEVKGLTVP